MQKAKNSGPAGKRRILLVDDHPVVRIGFSQLLNLEPDFQVCAEAASAGEALQAVEKHKPDLAIIDISLNGTNGIELIKVLQSLHPDLLLLALSMHPESIYAQRCLRAGAKGYIMKHAPTEEVMRAIREVLLGKCYLSPKMKEAMVNQVYSKQPPPPASPIDQLTDRELEIFSLVGQGIKTALIASKLNLSIKTVETHRAHIKQKLGLKTAMDLITSAVRWTNRPEDALKPPLPAQTNSPSTAPG